jgi:release factor glutamine methyltransferase
MNAVSAATPLSLRDLRMLASRTLKAAGIDNAEREALWLLAAALDSGENVFLSASDRSIAPADAAAAWTYIRRRAAREPLQYILGTQEFRGLEFSVAAGVFIPRPETECLVDETIARIAGEKACVADVGTGSGCIAVTIARECPLATVYAIDISPIALAFARSNAAQCGVQDRIRFVQSDLLEPFSDGLHRGEGIFRVIISNPPYIAAGHLRSLQPEVSRYEPSIALTAGPDGLACYRRLLGSAAPLLAAGGYLILELGFGQADAVKDLVRAVKGLLVVACRKDQAGIDRVLILERVA